MAKPQGLLTAAQIEIMEVIWQQGKTGATVAEIWQAISAKRDVARTTVLTMVNRLEHRGWLLRKHGDRGLHYIAARGKEGVTRQMAAQFVDEMFGGSAVELVRSLLGTQQITWEEIRRLRELLDQMDAGEPS
jgi:BlaI family transcriptional regulator, penicillinase repressor